MIGQYSDKRYSIYKLCIVIYIIFLFVLLRGDVRYLKIQLESYHDDREWKYHEWEISSIEADGTLLDVKEAYPDIEYACIPYSPEIAFKTIVFTNPEWEDQGVDARTVSIALGNTKIYTAELQIENGAIRLEQLDSVWKNAERLYYKYMLVLSAALLVGCGFLLKCLIFHKKYLHQKCQVIFVRLAENRKSFLTWGAVWLLFGLVSLIVLKNGHFFEDMQGFLPRLEWCTYIGAILCVFAISYTLLGNRKDALLVTVIAAVPLFLSIHDITLFQKKDDCNNITELMWLSQDVFRHWSYSNTWTHYLLMGTAWKIIPEKYAMIGVTPIHMNSFQTAKVIHWICGFGVTIGIVAFAYKRFAPKDKNSGKWSLALLFFMIFSLPVWALGMKMYNYDLFSMLFCVWGILCMIDYLLSRKSKSKIWSLICMGIAVQEKEFVIVYMLIAMVVMLSSDIICHGKDKIVEIIADSALIYLIPLIPIVFTDYWVSMVLRGGNRAVDTFARCLNCYTDCTNIALSKLGVSYSTYMVFVITYVCVVVGAVVCLGIYKYVYSKLHEKKRDLLIADIFLGAFVLLSVIGILFAFQQGNIPETSQGGKLYTLLGNIYGYIGYVPSIYLIFGVVFFAYLLLCRRKIALKERQVNLCLISSILFGGAIWLNIIAGIFQGYLESLEYRYQNIQQMINIICIWILLCMLIESRRLLVSIVVFAGVLLETIWSFPGFSIFYPTWNTTIYKEGFLFGGDGGEGNGVAGEMIEKYCIEHGISFKNAHIYSSYFTPWGDNNYGIECQYLKTAVENKSCEWDDNDFYVVFSNSIPENNVQVVIPEEIAPIMTIRYRGVERGWIYQGSQLRDCYPFDEW